MNFAAFRKRLRLSQDGGARLFGVSRETWRNWEHGKVNIPPPVRVLAIVLDRRPELVEIALTTPTTRG